MNFVIGKYVNLYEIRSTAIYIDGEYKFSFEIMK